MTIQPKTPTQDRFIVTDGYEATKSALEGEPADAELMSIEQLADFICALPDAPKGGQR